MDLFYSRLSMRGKAIVDAICYIFLFFPLMIILNYTSGEHAIWSIMHGERASASSWRPILGPFKILISIGFMLFLLQGVVGFLRAAIAAIRGGNYES